MKLPLLSLLLFALAQETSLTGDWQLQIKAAGNEMRRACTFVHQDGELSGSCETSSGRVKITGKADGKSVTWSYKTELEGSPLTVVFKGALDSSGAIAGTVTAVEYGIEGEFTASRVKP